VTPDGVYENEMARPTRSSASEEWPAGDPALTAFAEDLRVVAGGPAPEPRPGLLAVMRQGPTVPIDSPEETGRKRMLVKTLLGGLAAKVALGAGVAVASVTAAGAAGVLPEPVHNAVASVVSAATPIDLPDRSELDLQEVVDDVTSTTTSSTSTTSTTLAGDDDGGTAGDGTAGRTVNHGACVSAAARDKAESEPGSHGRTVSSIARTDCGKEATSTTSTVPSSSTTSSTSTTLDDGQRSASSGSGSANSGRGNGGNSGNGGNGNGRNGNGGNGNGGPGSSARN
jgi:hypothetical protein